MKSKYTLYGCRRSGSLIIEIVLSEIGQEYDLIDIDLETDAQRDETYASINPQRKLPTLITPTGETLTESAAIVLTLEERYPEASLLPPHGSPERATALRILMLIATELYPIIEINDYPERFTPRPEQSVAVREIAREIWRQRWRVVEQEIQGNPFLLSGGYCLTDIYIAVVSRWAQQDSWRPSHIPKVERLTAAVAARPEVASIWNRHNPQHTPERFA